MKSTRHRENQYVDRNAQFHSLSLEEREYVQCVEYRAVKLLGYMITAYYFIWQFFGCLVLGIYLSLNYTEEISREGFNPWYVYHYSLSTRYLLKSNRWLGASLAIGAFNNSGISLLDTSVVSCVRLEKLRLLTVNSLSFRFLFAIQVLCF